jgi:uncharacterized membrane protein
MTQRLLRGGIAVLSLAGAAVTTYMLSVRWSGNTLLCSTGGCETVQNSSYSELLGVPVALLGLLGYLALAATTLRDGPGARTLCAALALGALGFGGYLLVIQLAVIDAVCDWCLATDTLTALIAAAAVLRLVPGISGSGLRITA